jgi:SOS-response transcriptional repressor LexA
MPFSSDPFISLTPLFPSGKSLMASFTPTQGRYLAFIRAYTDLHGYPPAESEIAASLCVSPPSVNQMVKQLERRGLISRQPGVPRTIRVLIPEDELPVWGKRKRASRPEQTSKPPGSHTDLRETTPVSL